MLCNSNAEHQFCTAITYLFHHSAIVLIAVIAVIARVVLDFTRYNQRIFSKSNKSYLAKVAPFIRAFASPLTLGTIR